MKKLILASTIAALSMTAAHAAPTIYGKAGVELKYSDVEGSKASKLSLDSKMTRFGVKGGEQLTANTKAVYQLEYALDSVGDNLSFSSRDTFVGLQNNDLGSLKLGRLSGIDEGADLAFATGYGSINSAINGGRWNSSLVYSTPDLGGLNVHAQYAVDASDYTEGSFAVAADYKTGPMTVAGSYVNKAESADDAKDSVNALRASASFSMSPALKVAGVYQITDFEGNDNKENALSASVSYDVANSPLDVFGQFSTTENVAGTKDASSRAITAGANYAFTAATTGMLVAGTTDYDSTGDADDLTLKAAIVHSF